MSASREINEKRFLLRHLVSFPAVSSNPFTLSCCRNQLRSNCCFTHFDIFIVWRAKQKLQLDPLNETDNVHSFKNAFKLGCAMILIDIFIHIRETRAGAKYRSWMSKKSAEMSVNRKTLHKVETFVFILFGGRWNYWIPLSFFRKLSSCHFN